MSCATCPCCCCCTTSRGAAFFCTSIHVFLGMYLLKEWILVTYIKGHHTEYFEDERMRFVYPILLIYLVVFVINGFVNFVAVEKEAAAILKWSMKFFLLLQLSMLLSNTLLGFAFPELENDLAVHRVFHVNIMILNVVMTSIYFYIMWRYVYSLENGIYVLNKKRQMALESPPETLDRPSAPWSDSPTSTGSRLHHDSHRRGVIDDQTLPLKTVTDPQPCSSKDASL